MSRALVKALMFLFLTLPDGQLLAATDNPVKNTTTSTMTIAGRTYEILGFLKGNEKRVDGNTMASRVKELKANLGEEEGRHILKHQDEIPVYLRYKAVFVFTDWRNPGNSKQVACVVWLRNGPWLQGWGNLGDDWFDTDRVLRRK